MTYAAFNVGMTDTELDQVKADLYSKWIEEFKTEVREEGGTPDHVMIAAATIGWIDGFEAALKQSALMILDTLVAQNANRF